MSKYTAEQVEAAAESILNSPGLEACDMGMEAGMLHAYAELLRGSEAAKPAVPIEPMEMPTVFGEWFGKNYPGPDTIISNPHWHAPRIWRAAQHSMLAAARSRPHPPERVAVPDGFRSALRQALLEAWNKGFADGEPMIIEDEVDRLMAMLAAAPQPPAVDGSMVISKEGQELLAQCIAGHGVIVGALVGGRPDLALAEAQKWTESFLEAAQIIREWPAEGEEVGHG